MDYIIKDGWIVNGKKEKPFHGDLVIKMEKLRKWEHILRFPGLSEREYSECGRWLCNPGFIDIHRHGDWQAFGNGDDQLLNRRGLTTVVNGNCGLSVAPAGESSRKKSRDFSVV